MRILIAEDEKALNKVLKKLLEKANFTVDSVFNGEDALVSVLDGSYDAVLLDIMMPKMDGINVLRRLRQEGNQTPVILLTAKSEVEDKVMGLDCGADDYIAKPFDSRELLARIRRVTRSKTEVDSRLIFGNVILDRSTYELSTDSGKCRLASKEYQMFEYLMMNPNHVLSTDNLIERVWGYESDVEVSNVWVYISNLRKKLNELHSDIEIKALRNAGYILKHEDD